MSIERELLERVMNLIDYRYAPSEAVAVHREIKELLAQPEQTEQEDIRDVWQDGYEAGLRLAKREPLSDEEIQILYDRHAFAMESDEYMWGFRDAEKAHGIGGGE